MSPAALRRSLESRWSALAGNTRGAVWMLASGLVTTVQSVLVKSLDGEIHTFEVVFLRCVSGLAILMPLALRHGLGTLATGRIRLHVLRAAVSVTSMACSFYALSRLPLADATAYAFTVPLFMIPLAVLTLGETVRWRRWTATGAGFLGVLVMARPGGAADVAVVLALLAAFFTALVFVIVKRLTSTERVIVVMTYFTMLGAAFSLGPAVLVWQTPTPWQLALLFGIGATGTLSQMFAVHAWIVGEATAVAPFDYSRLLYATALGLAFFGEVPGLHTAAGAVVIAVSTLYIARREVRLGRKAASQPEA